MPYPPLLRNIRPERILDSTLGVMKHRLMSIAFRLASPRRSLKQPHFLNRGAEFILPATQHRDPNGGLGALPASEHGENLLEHSGPHETPGEVQGDVAGLVAEAGLETEEGVDGFGGAVADGDGEVEHFVGVHGIFAAAVLLYHHALLGGVEGWG